MMALRDGNFKGAPPPRLGHDPQGKVLGILGMGGIGRNLKKKAEAFGMTVQYYNRNKLSEELSGGAKYVSFDELLSTSDVLSLNLPLNVSESPGKDAHLVLTEAPETNLPHHLDRRVCQDEERYRDRQHSPRRRHGRSSARASPRRRQSLVLRPRRLRRGAQGAPGPDRQQARHAGAAHGHVDRRDGAQDGGMDD